MSKHSEKAEALLLEKYDCRHCKHGIHNSIGNKPFICMKTHMIFDTVKTPCKHWEKGKNVFNKEINNLSNRIKESMDELSLSTAKNPENVKRILELYGVEDEQGLREKSRSFITGKEIFKKSNTD